MIQDSKAKFFPLKAIAAETPYSADYLRLRILQGKLRGLKIGRDWYTTREWLEEYLERHSNKRDDVALRGAVRESDRDRRVARATKTSRRNFPKKLFLAPLAALLLFIVVSFAAASPHSWPERIAKAMDRAETFLLETPALNRAEEFAAAADGAIAAAASAGPRLAALISSAPSDLASAASSAAARSSGLAISSGSLIDSVKNFFSSLAAKIRFPSNVARFLDIELPGHVQNKTNDTPPPPAIAVSPAPPSPAPPPRRIAETVRVREVIERKEIVTPADTALFRQKLDELNSGLRSRAGSFLAGIPIMFPPDIAGLAESAADAAALVSSAGSQTLAPISSAPSDLASAASSAAARSSGLAISSGSLIDSVKNFFSSLAAKIRLPSNVARFLDIDLPRLVQNKTDDAPPPSLPPPAAAVSPAPSPLAPAPFPPASPSQRVAETVRVREVIERK